MGLINHLTTFSSIHTPIYKRISSALRRFFGEEMMPQASKKLFTSLKPIMKPKANFFHKICTTNQLQLSLLGPLMSFSDPSFLISSRPTDQERQAAKQAEEKRRQSSARAYRQASWVISLTMIYLALPLELDAWHWHVVIGAGSLLMLLGMVMAVNGDRNHALLSLLFALLILPNWVKLAPLVVKAAHAQIEVIIQEWKRVL